jgi:hypothetical protein
MLNNIEVQRVKRRPKGTLIRVDEYDYPQPLLKMKIIGMQLVQMDIT